MPRPFKFTRALAPAVFMGGGLCAAALGTTLPWSPPQVAPPWSPDGACMPRYETWGWYSTRWRPFPGDVISGTPTEAGETEGPDAVESLQGPQTPSSAQEGNIGPQRRPAAGG